MEMPGVSSIEKIGPGDFSSKVLGVSRPVLVEFTSTGCGHCTRTDPVLNGVAETHPGMDVYRVDLCEAGRAS